MLVEQTKKEVYGAAGVLLSRARQQALRIVDLTEGQTVLTEMLPYIRHTSAMLGVMENNVLFVYKYRRHLEKEVMHIEVLMKDQQVTVESVKDEQREILWPAPVKPAKAKVKKFEDLEEEDDEGPVLKKKAKQRRY